MIVRSLPCTICLIFFFSIFSILFIFGGVLDIADTVVSRILARIPIPRSRHIDGGNLGINGTCVAFGGAREAPRYAHRSSDGKTSLTARDSVLELDQFKRATKMWVPSIMKSRERERCRVAVAVVAVAADFDGDAKFNDATNSRIVRVIAV